MQTAQPKSLIGSRLSPKAMAWTGREAKATLEQARRETNNARSAAHKKGEAVQRAPEEQDVRQVDLALIAHVATRHSRLDQNPMRMPRHTLEALGIHDDAQALVSKLSQPTQLIRRRFCPFPHASGVEAVR